MKLLLTISLNILYLIQVNAQKENNNWYFGNMAAVNFTAGYPQSMTNSSMNAFEGCATISSPSGKLLFYTDGLYVWDSTHNVAMNGNDLKGNMSSTQSAIIVPRPGMPGRYYIFTVSNEANIDGLCYSEYDMSLNGKKGGVISNTKNTQLLTPTCEKIAAIHTDNGVDYWVMAHKWNSDELYTWKITPAGISSSPVISKTGVVINGNTGNTLGYMKFSPNANKIAYTNYFFGTSVIADFDNSTGKVSNTWTFPNANAYGLEFSSDGSFLYVGESDMKNIYQYDVNASSNALFISSRVLVDSGSSTIQGAIQLGADNKIYISYMGSQYLDAINYPNLKGTGCNYVKNAVRLAGGNCRGGLPTFIQSYPSVSSFVAIKKCYEDTTVFIPSFKSAVDSILWDFGEPSSSVSNYSTKKVARHAYVKHGQYHVKVIVFKSGKKDTVGMDIEIYQRDSVFRKVSVCESDSFYSGKQYYSKPGTYTEKFTNKWGCDSLFSFELTIIPAVHASQSLVVCKGRPVKVGMHTYSKPGVYTDLLKRGNGCDSIVVTTITEEKIHAQFDVDSTSKPLFRFSDKSIGYSLHNYWFLDMTGPVFTGRDYARRINAGHHKVCLQIENNRGCRDTSCMDVDIPPIRLYNVFTPNGDNVNEVFEFTDDSNTIYDLHIYDRWGVLVHEIKQGHTSVGSLFWNGKLMNTGPECPAGTYYFLLTLQDDEKVIEGVVQLIR